MNGSMVDVPSPRGTMPAYFSLPEIHKGAAVIVVQEWWGLVDHIKSVADRCADAGFVALAPDLYRGATARSPNDAEKMSMALNISEAADDMRAAAEYLRSLPNVTPKKVGIVGFCMGGQLALYTATEYPKVITACVDFYGVHPKAPIDPHKLQVPVLAHFGKVDRLVTGGDAPALVKRLSDAGKFIDAYFYDAGHAFFNDARPEAYNASAAALAWDRTQAFLRANLR